MCFLCLFPHTRNGNILKVGNHFFCLWSRKTFSTSMEILCVNPLFNTNIYYYPRITEEIIQSRWHESGTLWVCARSRTVACMLIVPQFRVRAVSDTAGLSEPLQPLSSGLSPHSLLRLLSRLLPPKPGRPTARFIAPFSLCILQTISVKFEIK